MFRWSNFFSLNYFIGCKWKNVLKQLSFVDLNFLKRLKVNLKLLCNHIINLFKHLNNRSQMTKKPQMSMNHLHQKMPHYILIHLDLTINRIITYMDSHIQDQQHITWTTIKKLPSSNKRTVKAMKKYPLLKWRISEMSIITWFFKTRLLGLTVQTFIYLVSI